MMRLARVKQETSTDRKNKGFRDAYRLLLHIQIVIIELQQIHSII